MIQYIYRQYGRERAGLAATVICYRGRSAIREVGKAFGLSDDTIGALAGTLWGWSMQGVTEKEAQRAGLDADRCTARQGARARPRADAGSRAISPSMSAASSSPARASTRSCRSRTPRWRSAPSSSGTRTTSTTLGLLKVDVLGLGMLSCLRRSFDLLRAHYGDDARRSSDAGRGPGGLRHDPARRHDRRVPDREPRADVDAAAAAPGQILRSRHRGRDRAAGADPGRHGASLSAPPAGPRSRSTYRRPSRAGGGAEEDARRAAVPGAGDAHRHRRGRLHARRGRQAAPRHGDLQAGRHHRLLSRQADRRHGGERLPARVRRALLQPDRGLRRVRLPREPRGELRQPGLRLVLDQMPLSGRVRRRPAQQPAHGLLRAGADRARRPGPWRRDPSGGREFLLLGLHAGGLLHPSPAGGGWPCEARPGGAPPSPRRNAGRHPHHPRGAARLPPDQRRIRGAVEGDRAGA